MKISLLNYAVPEADPLGRGLRWWHKSGSRWPATILERANDGEAYFPWPFLLCYLKSLLEAEGHQVELLDGCLWKWMPDQAIDAVRRTEPDWIVFETSEQTEGSDARIVARLGEVAPVALIGPNVAEDRADLLGWPGCRALIPGEYLAAVAAFFRAPAEGVAPRHEVVGREAMDALPFAHRNPEEFPRYSARFRTTPPGVQGQFVSMWGCQHRCKFCIWIHSYWPRTSQFRKHFSIPRLEAELDWMRARIPGITSLYDDADNHHYRAPEAYEFVAMMERTALPWAILTRADTYMRRDGEIDRDLWKAYRDAGCYAVKIGIEGAQGAMDATHKRLSEEVVRAFVPFMQDLGVQVYASFMLGVPGTGPEDDRRTLALVEDLASYRPSLFEYFVSRCDVTRVTPFGREGGGATPHDGQAAAEALAEAGQIPAVLGGVAPNNLSPS